MFDIPVLDKGFIKVYDDGVLGTDKTIVNAARVSFGKRVEKFEGKDSKLLHYLVKHKHTSPFRHAYVQFHIKWPEFVARQAYKHNIGAAWTSGEAFPDTAWNEISGRYTELQEFHEPEIFRSQSKDNKQGSAKDLTSLTNVVAKDRVINMHIQAMEHYHVLLALGVAKEQARMVLPVSFYTECYWTASFQAIINFITLRNKPEAQKEIRVYAEAMEGIMLDLFPESLLAWNKNA